MIERRSGVYSIPPSIPFLDTVADCLLDGGLFPDSPNWHDDPLSIADATILVPTRRAARALEDVFSRRSGKISTILPTIRPIGDIDEELQYFRADAVEDLNLPPTIDPFDRLLALTRLVIAYGNRLQSVDLRIDPAEQPLLPASAADAVWLANDLSRLMDAAATEEQDWAELGSLVPDDYATYWQTTLEFLRIATSFWPDILKQANRLDPAERRSRLIDAEAERLSANPPSGPVLAAGSTGSIPATARLMSTIAGLPNGAVILPGLDPFADHDHWAAIGGTEPSHGHPQYGLHRLMTALGVAHDDVVHLGPKPDRRADNRAKLVSHALRPAHTTELWRQPPVSEKAAAAAFASVTLIEARNEVDEALAIACAVRKSLSEGAERIAVVTPDRDLARRVIVDLSRWSIDADDAAGMPLARTPPGVFARLSVEAVTGGFHPVSLLALLKHPIAALGYPRAELRRRARLLEADLLRGPRLAPGLTGLVKALDTARRKADISPERLSDIRRRLSEEDRNDIEDLLARISDATRPLREIIANSKPAQFRDLTPIVIQMVRLFARDEKSGDGELFSHEAGEALAGFFARCLQSPFSDIALRPFEISPFFVALMNGVTVRKRYSNEPRVSVWGVLEARLQTVDVMILGGLNEGTWPADARTDPWLSRPMRSALGLEPPERRIGLSAHDFTQALGTETVIMTRAQKQAGAPSVASRWLQRLLAVLPTGVSDSLTRRGNDYLAIARHIDRPQRSYAPAERPSPAPPVAARPSRLSVSQIETWIRDPYAIYARHVLGLAPLDPIGVPPDAGMKGTLIHDALARFTATWNRPFDAEALRRLIEIGEDVFADLDPFPVERSFWWPRFLRIAEWFVEWEDNRSSDVRERFAEIDGRLEIEVVGTPFTLTGRADRIDFLRDGTLMLLDFKTGRVPSNNEVNATLAPQLPLEVAMINRGGFNSVDKARPVSSMAYVVLKGGADKGSVERRGHKDKSVDQLAGESYDQLVRLIAAYGRSDQPYLSRARIQFEHRMTSDYDHLARVREWISGRRTP